MYAIHNIDRTSYKAFELFVFYHYSEFQNYKYFPETETLAFHFLGDKIMSLKTLPILFLNLGGEMMYILDQRLRAQNIAEEKAKKGTHGIS